jgi:hypothetical protein
MGRKIQDAADKNDRVFIDDAYNLIGKHDADRKVS